IGPRIFAGPGSIGETRFMSPSSSKLRATEVDRDLREVLSKKELEAAHCWEADDRVPRRPEMTDFRRRLRYHQSQWREAQGYPIGSQPIAPQPNGGAMRRRKSPPARLRPKERRELPYRRRSPRGEG